MTRPRLCLAYVVFRKHKYRLPSEAWEWEICRASRNDNDKVSWGDKAEWDGCGYANMRDQTLVKMLLTVSMKPSTHRVRRWLRLPRRPSAPISQNKFGLSRHARKRRAV